VSGSCGINQWWTGILGICFHAELLVYDIHVV
jgi:bile acid:Na+ symporter, BASS family